ncbi:hypothetical protein [Methanomassiliicoccus luminyensis]|uniref:hypothetical protein n=1 Tax=Methanomassiliicoccus luminyensis TaxID=1080712 RepID=UPI000370C5E2|nr:hypothetical protein [Methanomassiliicoccus luminyensis]
MKNGNRILSFLMACMMVGAAFTIFAPGISAAPIQNQLGNVNVGEVVTLSDNTAQSGETLNVYIDQVGPSDENYVATIKADVNGRYTYSIEVPIREYGPISFIVADAGSGAILEQWDGTVVPHLTVEPTEGAPYSVSEKTVTLTGTGYKIGERVDFKLTRADGSTSIGSATPQPNDKGSVSITFEVPDIWEGTYELNGTQNIQGSTISATASFDVKPGVSIEPGTFKAGKAGILTVNGAGFTQNGEVLANSIEFRNGTTVVNTIHERTDINPQFGNFTIEDVSVAGFPVGGVYEVWIKYNKDLPSGTSELKYECVGTYYVGLWIEATPISVNVGADVTVTGHGFDRGVSVDIKLDGVLQKTVVTGASGSFIATFTMGNAEVGQHTITATAASGDSASTTITVGSYISIDQTSGTVGPTTTFETIDNVIVAQGSTYGSLGTQVTVSGNGFAANSKVNVTVSASTPGISWGPYRVVHNFSVSDEGAFVVSFIFPTAPNGTYTITADDSIAVSTSEFTVMPGIAIAPSIVIGPSVETIVATGYPQQTYGVDALLIDGTDALFGTNNHFTVWSFDSNGTLVSQWNVVAKPGFVLPILETGTYNIELVAGGLSASQDVIVLNNLADLGKMIGDLGTDLTALLEALDAKIVDINGLEATIQTALGPIESSLEDLDAKIVGVNDNLELSVETILGTIEMSFEDLDAKIVDINGLEATIQTALGPIESSLEDLDAKIVAVDGKLVEIKTAIGTIDGEISSIENGVATIKTDIGTMKTNISTIYGQTSDIAAGETEVTIDATPAWIAAIMAVIAAISSIVCVVIFTRKLAG